MQNNIKNAKPTKDTQKALEIISPMAEFLGLKVEADDHIMQINGQGIGIGCNSTYATINEFIGYVYLNFFQYDRYYRYEKKGTQKDVEQAIKTYWVKNHKSFGEDGEKHE